MRFSSGSPGETAELGAMLGQALEVGDVVCLYGEIGAGKTHFAQGVGKGMGVGERMTSPTFAFINEYQGVKPLMHADLYRVDDPGELEDIGIDEYLYGPWVSLVEWADRAGGGLPAQRLDVSFSIGPDGTRTIDLSPKGDRYMGLCEVFRNRALSGNRLLHDDGKRGPVVG